MDTGVKLQEIFRDIFDDEELEIYDEMTAADISEWDSLTHMVLIEEIEDKFGISFSTEEVMKIKSIGEIKKIIDNKFKH